MSLGGRIQPLPLLRYSLRERTQFKSGGKIRSNEKAAIDDDVVTRHEGRLARAHPKNSFGNFERCAEAADGMVRENSLVDYGIGKSAIGHRRLDDRGTDSINANALESVFERGGSR